MGVLLHVQDPRRSTCVRIPEEGLGPAFQVGTTARDELGDEAVTEDRDSHNLAHEDGVSAFNPDRHGVVFSLEHGVSEHDGVDFFAFDDDAKAVGFGWVTILI